MVHTNLFIDSDPFDAHFSPPEEDELARKIKAAGAKQWRSTKKELPEGLKLVYSVPDLGSDASMLPAMKNITNVKVSLRWWFCTWRNSGY